MCWTKKHSKFERDTLNVTPAHSKPSAAEMERRLLKLPLAFFFFSRSSSLVCYAPPLVRCLERQTTAANNKQHVSVSWEELNLIKMNIARREAAVAHVDEEVSLFLTPRALPYIPYATSTPRQSASKRKQKKFLRAICDTCEKCGKEYRCHRSYVNHVRGHNIVEKASRYPNITQISNHLSENCGKVFQELTLKPAFGEKGKRYKDFIAALISSHNIFISCEEWGHFQDTVHSSLLNGVDSSKFLLPTALITNLQSKADCLLSDVEKRKSVSVLFQVFYPCDEETFQIFLADYVLHLVMDVVKFISHSIRQNVATPVESGPSIMDIEYKETVHYIAGSKVRAFYKKSQQNLKHPVWKNIGRVITEKLLENDLVPGPPQSVKGWTTAQNRGRLFFVSAVVFDFFLGVANILEQQSSKLRVVCEDVTEKVCASGVILLWDDAVGDSMSESESFNFMCGMIKAFSQTFAIGKAKRVVDCARKKAEASVPLRHRLAS